MDSTSRIHAEALSHSISLRQALEDGGCPCWSMYAGLLRFRPGSTVPLTKKPSQMQRRPRHSRPCMRAFFVARNLRGLPARTADGQLQPVGEHPAVFGADGSVAIAVRGDGQHDGDRPVAVRLDGYLPPDVLPML